MSSVDIGPSRIVDPLALPGSLAQVITECLSGRARLADEGGARDVWFDEGAIVAVTSTHDDERIGAWLVRRRQVGADDVAAALGARLPGERIGAALVRRGALDGATLERELEALSLELLARMTVAGGELSSDASARLPADACTVRAEPRPLFIAALRAAADVGRVVEGAGAETGWVAVAVPTAGAAADLNDNERYVLSLLKRPRTLDGLRRAALVDFSEVMRAVAVLGAAGLIAACECRAAPPPARSLAEALGAASPIGDGGGAGEAAGPAASSSPIPPARRDVRAMLDALDEAEASAAPLCDIDGRPAGGAQRRRVVAMIEAAAEMLAAGEERRAVRQALNRAIAVFPAVTALLKLTELELADAASRPLALDRLQRILAKNPRCTEGWLLLGRYWEARGAPEKVRGCAAKILAYDPGNAAARRLAGDPGQV